MSDSSPHHVGDVLVVGCGPVGVMAALRCAQRGLRVTAIDRTAEIYPLPRAIGMDDEIQRLFTDAGLGAALSAVSTPLSGAEFLDADGNRVVGHEPPPGFVTRLGYPLSVMFDQPSLEAALRAAAERAGVEFRFGLEVIDVDPVEPCVVTQSSAAAGGQQRLTARWVIGADGASSTVRKVCSIGLDNQGFDQDWLVVDTTQLDPDLPLSPLAQQHCHPDRVVTFVPGHRNHKRWEFQLRNDETQDDARTPEFLQARMSEWGTPEQLRIDRSAVYRFHATVAERFRVGSVFLAGDAAHQMPPFNGQGMCTGMRDAENLSWKLAAVRGGVLPEEVLDTYEVERLPHATGQVAHSAAAGRLIDAIARGGARAIADGYGGGRPFPHLERGLLDLDCGHDAVGRPLPLPSGIAVDELGSMLGPDWALISAVQGGPARSAETVDAWARLGAATVTMSAEALPLLAEGATVVVRPDRYIAAVTADLDATTSRLFA
ncbi:MAG: bifunctional 3-(3-hydroxy-phenyl)propionate/3-hydroxycinnamic acid hydroxylase [Actinomycetota bacterium]